MFPVAEVRGFPIRRAPARWKIIKPQGELLLPSDRPAYSLGTVDAAEAATGVPTAGDRTAVVHAVTEMLVLVSFQSAANPTSFGSARSRRGVGVGYRRSLARNPVLPHIREVCSAGVLFVDRARFTGAGIGG